MFNFFGNIKKMVMKNWKTQFFFKFPYFHVPHGCIVLHHSSVLTNNGLVDVTRHSYSKSHLTSPVSFLRFYSKY